jgi:hypothetical protein
MLRYLVLASLASGLIYGPAAAQRNSFEMPPEFKEVQIRQLESERRLLVAMADSMPERLYRDKATPAQRDFAQQITHAVGAVVGIGSRFAVPGSTPPDIDHNSALQNRAELTRYINAAYGWATEALRSQPESERAENVSFFGLNIPRWQIWGEINQHTIWTAGQIVANFRKHDMPPPAFAFF